MKGEMGSEFFCDVLGAGVESYMLLGIYEGRGRGEAGKESELYHQSSCKISRLFGKVG